MENKKMAEHIKNWCKFDHLVEKQRLLLIVIY